MRLRPDPASRVERVASFAAATAITVSTALFVLAPTRPRLEGESGPAPVRHTEQASERLAYVIPRAPAPPVAPVRPQARMSDRHAPSTASPSQPAAPPAITPSVVPDTGNGSASRAVSPLLKPDAPATNWWSTVGHAPASGLAKGLLGRAPEAMRFDSALRVVHDSLAADLAPGRLKSPALTQTERDVQLRAKALADFARGTTGGTNPRTISGGASVPIGLPFGGPSREQRQRDSATSAQNKEIQARIQRRVDSTVAARQQRHVDSLARLDHASRQGTGLQY